MENSTTKICQVCGDKASNYNFGGLSCETCKIFFRRNAPKYEKLKCKGYTEKCLIDSKLNRKKCKRCRLKKCFSVGMRKELIYLKKENNRGTCMKTEAITQNAESIEMMLSANICTDSSVKDVEPIFAEFSQLELVRYNEIQQAMSHFPHECILPPNGEARDLLHAFNLPALYMIKTVKFCQDIKSFRSLSQNDQMFILSEFFTEMFCLRFAFMFDIEKDASLMIEDESESQTIWIQMNIFAEYNKRPSLSTIFREFCMRLNIELIWDCELMNLLVGYFLFNERQHVSCTEYLKTNRSIYDRLLRKYLDHMYPSDKQKYASLMSALDGVSTICKITREVYASFPIDRLSKVLAQIYNPGYHRLTCIQTIGFSRYNSEQISELQNSCKIDDTKFEIINWKPNCLLEILNLSEFYVRKAVKFCGYFSGFKTLCEDEQKKLLKSSVVQMMIVYLAYFYDHKKDRLKFVVNEAENKAILIDFQRCLWRPRKMVMHFKKLISIINVEIENNILLRNLIMIQLLFKPCQVNPPLNIEYMTYNFAFHQHLMLRYLEYHSKDRSSVEIKLLNIMKILSDIESVDEMIRDLYTRQIDSTQLTPLLKEVFDIY